MESQMKFRSPQNISGASQFSYCSSILLVVWIFECSLVLGWSYVSWPILVVDIKKKKKDFFFLFDLMIHSFEDCIIPYRCVVTVCEY